MRVDALTLAYRIPASAPGVKDIFEKLQSEEPCGAVQLGRLICRVWPAKVAGRFCFESGLLYGIFDKSGAQGWTLEVVPRAIWLAQASAESIVAACTEFALALADGELAHDEWGPRLRRIDLCADFAGWDLSDLALSHWMLPRNARGAKDCATSELDPQKRAPRPSLGRVYARGQTITGFTIAPGGFLMARCYDKLEELRHSEREKRRDDAARERHQLPAWNDVTPKTDVERAAWRKHGWDGREDVTRLEFQIRGRALDQWEKFNGRNPVEVLQNLDAIWQYCTRWTRLIVPDTDTRIHRCEMDARWEAARAVRFQHEAEPATRFRVRRGPTAAATLGNVIAYLAARGSLGDLTIAGRPVREWVGVKVGPATISDATAQWNVARDLEALGARWIETLQAAVGEPQACEIKLATKCQESFGRFATFAEDDDEEG